MAADSDDSSAGDDDEKPVITDIGIFYQETDTALGYATRPKVKDGKIDAKGETLDFDSRIYWNDGSINRNDTKVTWSVSDSSIATINQNGRLTPKDNGTVTVEATVEGKYTQKGQDLVAKADVKITGQKDERYVTKVRIYSSKDENIGTKTYILEEDLATSKEAFYAKVDVYDPATKLTKTYSTKNETLAKQVPELGNLVWSVSDTSMGSIDETSGLYRPRVYGQMRITVASLAGKAGDKVSQTISVRAKDPDGGVVQEGSHPQDSLTIKAYYETQKPDDMDGNDEKFVINQTFSLGELEGMNLVTQTYTALGSGSYFTITGCGVPLSDLLKKTGVNIAGIKTLAFGTADAIDRPVSYNYIFGRDRFYYPNIDCGSYAEAVQVYPIVALESNEVKNDSTEPNYDMSEGTRFRLLFGSTPAGGTSQYQIKWIHTIYVILKGGPAVESGDGDGDGKSDKGTGTGAGTTGKPGKKEASKKGTAGKGTGKGSGSGSGKGKGTDQDGSGTGGESAAEQSPSSEQGEGESGDGKAKGSSGSYSVYQVMNANDSDVQNTLDYDNPLKGIALPVGLVLLVLGGFDSVLWYRRQKRPTGFV